MLSGDRDEAGEELRLRVLKLVCLVDDQYLPLHARQSAYLFRRHLESCQQDVELAHIPFSQCDYIALWSEGFMVVELMLHYGLSGLSAAM